MMYINITQPLLVIPARICSSLEKYVVGNQWSQFAFSLHPYCLLLCSLKTKEQFS